MRNKLETIFEKLWIKLDDMRISRGPSQFVRSLFRTIAQGLVFLVLKHLKNEHD